MKKTQSFIKAEKLQDLGSELMDVYTDIQMIRAFSEGFERPTKLDKGELYISYTRAFKFFELLHSKAERLESQLDNIGVILLGAGNHETLREYLTDDELIEIDKD